MEITKKEFIDILNIASMGISNSSAVYEMQNYNFYKDHLLVYNGSLFLNIPCPLNGIEFSVPAKKFYSAVAAMPKKFELLKNNNQIELHGKSKKITTNFGLSGLITENITHQLNTKIEKTSHDLKFKELPSNFLEGVRLCMFSAAKSSNFGTLTCLSIKDDLIISSDNLRISAFTLTSEMPECLLPVENWKTLLKLNPTSYIYNDLDNMMHFLTEENLMVSIRVVKGHYPDYKKIIDQEYDEYEDLILPNEFTTMVADVGIMNQDVLATEQYVKLTITQKNITVATQHITGWASKELQLSKPLNTNISDFSVTLVLQSLLEITKTVNKVRVITQEGKNNRILFLSDNFRHILPTLQEKS